MTSSSRNNSSTTLVSSDVDLAIAGIRATTQCVLTVVRKKRDRSSYLDGSTKDIMTRRKAGKSYQQIADFLSLELNRKIFRDRVYRHCKKVFSE